MTRLIVLSFALWLTLLYALFQCGHAKAAVYFREADGGFTQWDAGVNE